MKNIAPISPLNEIVPDPQPPEPQPAVGSQNLAPQPTLTQTPSSLPPAAPVPPQEPVATPSIYPTPLTSQERAVKQAATIEASKDAASFVFSQYAIPFIVGIYGLYSLWSVLKAMISEGVMGAFGVNTSLLYGDTENYMWLKLLLTFIQTGILLYASFKIWQASKAGLALVTGASLLVLPQFILLYVILGSKLSYLFKDPESLAWLVGSGLLTISLVLAWTKDRKFYS